jgi:hypothetical protein
MGNQIHAGDSGHWGIIVAKLVMVTSGIECFLYPDHSVPDIQKLIYCEKK